MMMMLVSEIPFGDIRLHSIGFTVLDAIRRTRTTSPLERVSCGQRLAQRWMNATFLGTSKKGRG